MLSNGVHRFSLKDFARVSVVVSQRFLPHFDCGLLLPMASRPMHLALRWVKDILPDPIWGFD